MPDAVSRPIPTGTVTFLFTDIEASTKHWEEAPGAMRVALAHHDAILREAIEQSGGYVFKTVGDAFCAAFVTPHDALQAAIDLQHALLGDKWPGEVGQQVMVRVALHTGVTEERDGDYFGPTLNRVARLQAAGHGGQTLLSLPTYELVRDHLPQGVQLLDMGEHRLKDLLRPERVYQVISTDLPTEFPPLKTLDTRPNNLPRQSTAFIGREIVAEVVCTLLRRDDTTLITLTGPGGTGKTRLALHAAAELLDDFSGGVWFVDLAPIVESSLVIPTIAQALGMKETGSTPILDTLKAYLRDKQILIVLDNFEQLLSLKLNSVGAAAQVGQLIASALGLKVLVTSRIPLRVQGEREYPVQPLLLPDYNRLPSLAHWL